MNRRIAGWGAFVLSGVVATMSSCNALLGLNEGKDRPSPGSGSGSGGAGGAGGASGASSSGSGGAGGADGGPSGWSESFGDKAEQTAASIATDPEGNVIIAGSFAGVLAFGDKSLLSAGQTDWFLAKLDKDGKPLWARRFGDADYNGGPGKIAVDKDGNIFVGGKYNGTLTFDTPVPPISGTQDLFVAAFDKDGKTKWAKSFVAGSFMNFGGLAVDPSSSVIVTGTFNQLQLGTLNLTAAGSIDIYFAKISGADGAVVWGKQYGSAGASNVGYSVAVDSSGSIFLSGSFEGKLTFDQYNIVDAVTSSTAFLVKFDNNGKPSWVHRIDQGARGEPRVALNNSSGDVFVTGRFGGSSSTKPLDVDGKMMFTATPAGAGYNAYVAAFGTGGNPLWVKGFGDPAQTNSNTGVTAVDVVVDGAGNILLAGTLDGTVDFGGGVLTAASSPDIFVAKLASDGAYRSSMRFGDKSGQFAAGIAAPSTSGALFLAGSNGGTVQFDIKPLTTVGLNDIVLAKLFP
jgi:hypothetical protein